MRFCLPLLLLLLFQPSAISEEPKTPAISPGKALQPKPEEVFTEEFKENRRAVIIYYVNDTFPPGRCPRYHATSKICELLTDSLWNERSEGIPDKMRGRVRELSDRIYFDSARLISQADAEVPKMVSAIRRYPNSGIFVIQNHNQRSTLTDTSLTIRDDHYIELRWAARTGESEEVTYGLMRKIPRFSDPHHKSQPLSNGTVLLAAIEAAVEHFGADKARFALIIKGMGSPNHLLAPSIRTELNDLFKEGKQDVIFEILYRELSKDSKLRRIVDGKNPSIIYPTLNEIFVREFDLDPAKGIAKQDFMNEIIWFGGGKPEQRLYFPYIILDGNQTALSLISSSEDRNADLLSELDECNNDYSKMSILNAGYLYETEGDWRPEQLDFTKLWSVSMRHKCEDIHECLEIFLEEQSP